ncbi:MAG: PadR family transcriptional regulator [Actinobacteria bacterium]|nr:PadR family transcriptional regulator [Actinomycetota bacterium]
MGKVILGSLRATPRSGYEIKQLVDGSTRFFWAASYGQIYPELARLGVQGLVERESAPTGGRRRTVHSLTEAGRRALHDWLVSPEPLTMEVRDEGLLKVFFADTLASDEALAVVRAKRAHHEAVVARLEAVEPYAAAERAGGQAFPPLTLEYGLGLNRWIVAWCADVEERLSAGLPERQPRQERADVPSTR